jgi:ABC-2 type transport system ATP-binding protein
MSKLKVTPKQKISTMSCGQRSQVALGLILAQDPDLLILDDFSMGLDPGYRRLFIDYMREYAKAEHKTVFVTSHIIQDMERLIDDVMIMDYNKILAQQPVEQFMNSFRQFNITLASPDQKVDFDGIAVNIEKVKDKLEFYTYSAEDEVKNYLVSKGIEFTSFEEKEMTLEDAFIGLTRKY